MSEGLLRICKQTLKKYKFRGLGLCSLVSKENMFLVYKSMETSGDLIKKHSGSKYQWKRLVFFNKKIFLF